MRFNKGLDNLLSEALTNDLLFSIFRFPNQEAIHFIHQRNAVIKTVSAIDLTSSQGFLVSPFLKEEESVWIGNDVCISDFEDIHIDLSPVSYNRTFQYNGKTSGSKEFYLKRISEMIESIQSGEASKIVFSRSVEVAVEEEFISSTFSNLLSEHNDAFVFLLNLPGKVTWIGASPELLLEESNLTCKTMALAGSLSKENAHSAWSEKDLEEQSYVARYIEDILQNNSLTYRKSERYDKELKSGIKHLCTDFSFELPEKAKLKELLFDLHPTPAVCGIPLSTALTKIKRSEEYNRSYYTGFLGPVNLENRTSLFVNLRSAQCHSNKCCVYMGGGIVGSSDPEKEWQETEMKSTTILNAINSQHKLRIFNE